MYLKPKDIMEKYQIARSTVSKILSEMIASERYPSSAVVGGSCIRVDSEAFQDYMENRNLLKNPIMKKYVKPYKGRGNNG